MKNKERFFIHSAFIFITWQQLNSSIMTSYWIVESQRKQEQTKYQSASGLTAYKHINMRFTN